MKAGVLAFARSWDSSTLTRQKALQMSTDARLTSEKLEQAFAALSLQAHEVPPEQ